MTASSVRNGLRSDYASFFKEKKPAKVKRYGLNRVSPKMQKRLVEYRRVKAIWWAARMEIDGGRCQFPSCLRRSCDTHHVAGRSGQNLLNVDSFRALCRAHHNYVHDNPRRAREMGLLR